jgi:tetratricopeptide (TPR) repeat protein
MQKCQRLTISPPFLILTLYLLLVLTGWSSGVRGQSRADSLRMQIDGHKDDLPRLGLLYTELSIALAYENADTAWYFARKGLQLSEKTRSIAGIRKACAQLGALAFRDDSLDLAQQYYERSARLITPGADSTDLMKIWNGLAFVYDLRADFPRALNSYMNGLEIAEKVKSDKFRSYFYNNIGIIYDRTGSYAKGLEFYRKALTLFRVLHDSASFGNALVNIGIVHKTLGNSDSAYFYFHKALPVQERQKNYYGISNLYLSLGELKLEEGKLREAMSLFQLAQENIGKLGDQFTGSTLYLTVEAEYDIGRVLQQQGQSARAMEHFKQVRAKADAGAFLSFSTEALLRISEVFETMGRPDSALKYARLYQASYDSLKTLEDKQRLFMIENNYEYKKHRETEAMEKEREVMLEKRRELRRILLVAVVVILSVLFLLLYIIQRIKTQRARLIESNLQLEKLNLQKDLELKNRELTCKVMSLVEKNELQAELYAKLKKIAEDPRESESDLLRSVIHDLEQRHSKGFWEEFDIHFRETHADFYHRLGKEFPDLSPNELRLCAFLKLNLSTKEIAHITRKNEHSIKIARYRLRLQLGLSHDDNLGMFLSRF